MNPLRIDKEHAMRKMLIWGLMTVALFMLFFLPASSAETARKHPPERYVAPMQAALLLVEERERVYLLDVRLAWEYVETHIRGAVNIPVQALDRPEKLAKLPKGRSIILYGRRGGSRAEQALSVLLSKGYNAYSIEGGITAWWRAIHEPPSLTMSPYGKKAIQFRMRKGLRSFFEKVPAARRAEPKAPPAPGAPPASGAPPPPAAGSEQYEGC
ncbi:rhodanese-like domain-containing protein [Nitrospinota bacterium]